jgi:hypothetical protein
LIGELENPFKTFLVESETLNESLTANVVAAKIVNILRILNMKNENFVLLLSDAAPYMTAAGIILKNVYFNLFHVTCMAHLLHNCAMRIKSHYYDVDLLISAIKSLTIKNKTNRDLFDIIGIPPNVIPTRWGSWLKASKYYAEKFLVVKK